MYMTLYTKYVYLHQLQQLLAQLGVVGQQDGLPLGVNACPASAARHLAIVGRTQHTFFTLNSLVMMPAYHSCQVVDLSPHIHPSIQLNSKTCSGCTYPILHKPYPHHAPEGISIHVMTMQIIKQ